MKQPIPLLCVNRQQDAYFVHLSGVHHSSSHGQGCMQYCKILEYLGIERVIKVKFPKTTAPPKTIKLNILCLTAKQFLLKKIEREKLTSTDKPYPGFMERCANKGRLYRVSFSPRELFTTGVSGRQKHRQATKEK